MHICSISSRASGFDELSTITSWVFRKLSLHAKIMIFIQFGLLYATEKQIAGWSSALHPSDSRTAVGHLWLKRLLIQ
jgi:hypothetical protein